MCRPVPAWATRVAGGWRPAAGGRGQAGHPDPFSQFAGYVGCAMGLSIPALGVKPHAFGTAVITSVGMMGLDTVFAPFTPFAHVPVLVAIGAIRDRPVCVNGGIEARPVMPLNATIDHRFMDGAQVREGGGEGGGGEGGGAACAHPRLRPHPRAATSLTASANSGITQTCLTRRRSRRESGKASALLTYPFTLGRIVAPRFNSRSVRAPRPPLHHRRGQEHLAHNI